MNPQIRSSLVALLSSIQLILQLLINDTGSPVVASPAKTPAKTTPVVTPPPATVDGASLLGDPAPATVDGASLLGDPTPAAAAAAPVVAAPAKKGPNLEALAKARAAAAKKRADAAAAAPVVAAPTAESIKQLGMSLLKKDSKGGGVTLQKILKDAGAANLSALAPANYPQVQAALTAAIG